MPEFWIAFRSWTLGPEFETFHQTSLSRRRIANFLHSVWIFMLASMSVETIRWWSVTGAAGHSDSVCFKIPNLAPTWLLNYWDNRDYYGAWHRGAVQLVLLGDRYVQFAGTMPSQGSLLDGAGQKQLRLANNRYTEIARWVCQVQLMLMYWQKLIF